MRTIFAGALITTLPLVTAVGLVAFPKPRAVPVQIPITGQAVDGSGTRYTFSGTVSLTVEIPAPLPTPDPISLAALTVSPATVTEGMGATGTVTLSRAPLLPVQITLKALDRGLTVPVSVTINPGQSSGTFAIGTLPLPAASWLSLSASLNGQSRVVSLFVKPALPAPTPTPLPGAPVVLTVTNVDGTPLDKTPVYAQKVRITGSGLGSATGTLFWNGFPVGVDSWSDTEVRGAITWEAAGYCADWFTVRRSDGQSYSGLVLSDGSPVVVVPPPFPLSPRGKGVRR